DKEMAIVGQVTLASVEQERQGPGAVAFTTMSQLTTKWPKGDPRYPESVAGQIDEWKKVKTADVRQFWKDFAGAGHGELAVVGDFDPAAVTAQIEKLALGWQTKKPYARLAEKPWNMPGVEKSINIKDKEQTTIAIGEDIAMRDVD